jgi:CDGSH iron-sulfur domain-containing protein 3
VYTAIRFCAPLISARPACLLGTARIQSRAAATAAAQYDTSKGRGRGEGMDAPIPAQKEPYGVNVEAGKRYFWCACGRSSSQPFCDGSHKGTGLTPILFTAEATEEVWLCGCKATAGKPFCDGTHNTL